MRLGYKLMSSSWMQRKPPKRHVDARNKKASALVSSRTLDKWKELRETEAGAVEVEEAEI
jgi:hypothetical protein